MEDKSGDLHDPISNLRHNINNQLSGITLAVAQLEYELKGIQGDHQVYLGLINESCTRITELLKNAG